MANKEPEVITEKTQMRKWSRMMRSEGKVIGLVPTMGYLHEGHISLIKEAKKHSDVIVVSIYVNPGQFAPTEDLSTYPSDFHGDVQKLVEVGGVDVVFHPHNLYDYGNLSFENGGGGGFGGGGGVATVVAKLFNIVEPDVAVFGKKDYQQWRIIRRMVRDLDFAIEVIGSDIVRESDGLAMSSRNVHLSPEDREKALSINQALLRAKAAAAEQGQRSCQELITSVTRIVSEAGGKVDYAEIVDQESLTAVEEIKRPVVFCIAAWFGKRSRLLKKMSLASSKLNPHAAAYVPLAKRVEDESKLAPVHFDSSKAFTGSSYNNTTEFHSEEGQLEMDLAYLQTLFPSVSEQSLIDVYFVNECDLDAAYDMMSQLEHSDSVSLLGLPDSLEIGDVSEPHILPEFANLKLKELEGVSSSASVNFPAHAQSQK
ncbi:unnamed protein product [Rhodiola kirilowii]